MESEYGMSTEERAEAIAKAILKLKPLPDIIALQEVFDEDAKDELEDALKGTYPHYVYKLDSNDFIDLDEDSGLMLFSRFPFTNLPNDQYKAGDVTEEHSDAANADVGKAQVEQNINNDPNYQKGESTNPGKIDGKNKKQPDDPVVGKSSATKAKYKKIASLKRQEKIKLFAFLAANKVNPLNYVEAMVGIKLANMTEDEKNFIRKFWQTMYPREYVEEMVANR